MHALAGDPGPLTESSRLHRCPRVRELLTRNPPHGGGGRRPAAHILPRMTDTAFAPGDDVFTPHARGTVIDVRPTPSGKWVYGVEDDSGAVLYFTNRALRLTEF